MSDTMISVTIQPKEAPAEVVTIRRSDIEGAMRMAAMVAKEFNRDGWAELTIDVKVEP